MAKPEEKQNQGQSVAAADPTTPEAPSFGQIVKYTPKTNGYSQLLAFTLTPGVVYKVQYSLDGGLTWAGEQTVSVPLGTPEPAMWSSTLSVPGGNPIRLAPQV